MNARTTTTQQAHAERDSGGGAHPGTTQGTGRLARFMALARRVLALARMETTLLVRNKTALVNAVVAAPALVLILIPLVGDVGSAGGAFGAQVITMLAAFALLFIAYYNLTTTAVARREELTLKRLTSGEITHAEVLAGMATPAGVIIGVQLVLATVVVVLGFDVPFPVNPVLVLVALVSGFVAFALLGYASSGFTKTVESAQLTTLPVILVTMLASGIGIPLENLPDLAQRIAELTPLSPVVRLMEMGMTGVGPDGQVLDFAGTMSAALMPTLLLIGWCVLGVLATRRYMRWEPRR